MDTCCAITVRKRNPFCSRTTKESHLHSLHPVLQHEKDTVKAPHTMRDLLQSSNELKALGCYSNNSLIFSAASFIVSIGPSPSYIFSCASYTILLPSSPSSDNGPLVAGS